MPDAAALHADDHGHAHHAHHPALQHHFQTLQQQAEASTLGMWIFLVTEVMFFGGLFMAYLVYRHAAEGGGAFVKKAGVPLYR